MKTRTSLFVIGILIAMIAASLLTVLVLFLTGTLASKPELVFTVEQVLAKEYDGEPLKAESFKWESGSQNLKEGHRVEGRYYGSQTDVGTSDSDLRVKIYDKNDRDVTGQYSITVNNCELKVLKRKFYLKIYGAQIEYSGEEVFLKDYELCSDADYEEKLELKKGYKFALSFPGEFENVGDTMPATITSENYKIYDADGRSVSDNYIFAGGMLEGSVTIVPRKIKVKAVDTEKYYDGTPLQQRCELVSGTFVGGEYIGKADFVDENGLAVSDSIIKVEDSVSKARVSKVYLYKQEGYNTVYVGEAGDGVKGNYELVKDDDVYGSFVVNKRPVTVAVKNLIKTYDGEALSNLLEDNEKCYTATELPERFEIQFGNQKPAVLNNSDVCDEKYDLGTVKIIDKSALQDGSGAESALADGDKDDDKSDVSGQFLIIQYSGVAQITPITINVTLGEREEEYTGEEITVSAEEELSAAVEAYIASCPEDKMTEALSEKLRSLKVSAMKVKNVNTYTYTAALEEPNKNIIVNFSNGNVKVTPKTVTAQYNGNASKVYDGGEATSALDINMVGLNDNSLVVAGVLFKYQDNKKHTSFGNHVVEVTVTGILRKTTDGTEDVTGNYIVKPAEVNVTIKQRTITAVTNSPVLYLDSDDINNVTIDNLRYSITFENLAEGDEFSYNEDDFELDFNVNNVPVVISIDPINNKFTIRNKEGEVVTNNYILSNPDTTLITVYTKEAASGE